MHFHLFKPTLLTESNYWELCDINVGMIYLARELSLPKFNHFGYLTFYLFIYFKIAINFC